MGLILLVFGIVLVILGATLMAVGSFAGKEEAEHEQRCTAPAEAELVDTVERHTEWMDEIDIRHHGVYSFVTADGRRVEAEARTGYGRIDDIPGPRAAILYNPRDPEEFLFPQERESVAQALPGLRKAGIICLVIGVPLLICSVVFWNL